MCSPKSSLKSSIRQSRRIMWFGTFSWSLLVLADRDGVVDMTLDAISRRTNVPEEIVAHAIRELMNGDPKSRSHEEDGRRLVAIDSHRDWGWQIVNYEHYRNIKDEEARRTYFRDKKRAQRAKVPPSPQVSTVDPKVHTCPTRSTDSPIQVQQSHTGRRRGRYRKRSTKTLFATSGSVRDPLWSLPSAGRKGRGFQGPSQRRSRRSRSTRCCWRSRRTRKQVVRQRAGDTVHPSSGDVVQPRAI